MSGQTDTQPGSGYRAKFLAGKALDIEQIVLNGINEVLLAHLRVAQIGDATQANMIYIGLVLNLDAFVRPLIRNYASKANRVYYETKRTEIAKRWPVTGENPRIEDARSLFDLTVDVLAKERSFKMRRWTFFGEGWKEGKRADVDTMVQEDEREGPEELDTDSETTESS